MGRLAGRRLRKFFKTRLEADTYAEQQRIAKANQGAAAFSIDDKLRIEALEARRLLQPYGTSLIEAAKYYIKHAKPKGGQKTMFELVAEVLETKKTAGRRQATVDNYRILFTRFNRSFGQRHVHEVHRDDIENWLDANVHTRATRSVHLNYLSVLFTFAVKRNYCAANPLEGVERPQVTLKPPEIFSVEQATSLLRAAVEHPELELLPYIAIGLFAGLRPTEMTRLDWANVRLDQRVILVNAEASKTSQKRFVEISDNLLAWLQPIARESGPVAPSGLKRRVASACYKTRDYEHGKIEEWPRDGMRHSYASYHLAKHQNAPQTSLQMGHTSPQMLFNHYRNLVLAADAERYWKVTP
jgi:integrase